MKSLVTLLLLLLPCLAWSQADSLFVRADTLTDPAARKLDSLQHSFTLKTDSLKQAYTVETQRLASFRQKYLLKIDSLKAKRPITPDNPSDALGSSEDVSLYTKKIDSLDQQLESIQQRTASTLDSLKGTVNQQVSKLKLPKEANASVEALTSVMDKVNVPAFDSDVAGKLGLNNIEPGLPDISGTGILPTANLPNTNLPSVNPDIPGLKGNIPSTDINMDRVGEITGQAGDIQKQVTEATGSTEALGNTLESKASEHVKGLPDQKLPDAAGLPGGVPKTGDEAKEQLAQLAKKEAMNHFTGKEAVLTSAMDKMSKYKQKYSSVNSVKDIKDEKHHNELKGKPLRERLVPALTLQFQSWEDFMLDINPSVGYKVTSHFTAGIGWNQRIAFNIPQQQFNEEAKVYGVRTYGEYMLKKGFGFRLDIETMNTPAKQKDPATDVAPARDWVWGALVGVKQKYPIYKKLKGNAQLMYNIFDKDHRSPYLDRVNFRMGLEFTVKKKPKEKDRQK